ncbi:MAG: NHL repeat-containing protein [Gammaproteobacteria bacterium]|nr:NHL repeat-containing protein [Gammaproteobacteria bacterium]
MSRIVSRIRWTSLVVILTALGAGYALWPPSPQEPPYELAKTWGDKGAEPGQFNEPTGIAVVGTEVFVSDARNARIQVFDLDGRFLRAFGHGQLGRPMNLTIARGELYVADYFNDRIHIYSLDGRWLRAVGASGSKPGAFDAPGGVAVAANGDLLVADFYNQRVQQLHADGLFKRQWGVTRQAGVFGGKLGYPTGVALSADGTLFIADGYNDRVLAYGLNGSGPDGELTAKWGGPFAVNIHGPFNGWFATVTGIAVGPKGNVFVADFYNDRVQKFTPGGEFLNAFNLPGDGTAHTAIAVAVAEDGSVFVADYAHHQVQKWSPNDKGD